MIGLFRKHWQTTPTSRFIRSKCSTGSCSSLCSRNNENAHRVFEIELFFYSTWNAFFSSKSNTRWGRSGFDKWHAFHRHELFSNHIFQLIVTQHQPSNSINLSWLPTQHPVIRSLNCSSRPKKGTLLLISCKEPCWTPNDDVAHAYPTQCRHTDQGIIAKFPKALLHRLIQQNQTSLSDKIAAWLNCTHKFHKTNIRWSHFPSHDNRNTKELLSDDTARKEIVFKLATNNRLSAFWPIHIRTKKKPSKRST